MLKYETESDQGGKRHVSCSVCNAKWHTKWPLNRIHHDCDNGKSGGKHFVNGPGASLSAILRELGITKTAGCGCDEMIARMNQWGPACIDHRDEILKHLRAAYNHASLATKASALGAALWQGKPITLEGLLQMAIERAGGATTE